MIDIHYIHDLNLISARFHAVDLDVEQRCAELLPLLDASDTDPLLARIKMAQVRRIESQLAQVLIHVWPRPDDPVVHKLRAAAAVMVDRVRNCQ